MRVLAPAFHVPVPAQVEAQGERWKLLRFIRKVFKRPSVPPGRYTYRGIGEFTQMALQLRIESGGKGLLVINANTVLYLNTTAAAHAYFFMQGMPLEEAVRNVKKIFRVNTKTARAEHERLVYAISSLAQTEKICPTSYLDIKKVEPFTQPISAPIRMDLALTFKCQNNCLHCYTGGPHETPELTTQQWKKVITKVGQAGIFIITFTGGEPTLREDLPELLRHTQDSGIVSGLITNGRQLKNMEFVKTLEDAGLDFTQITLESHKPEIHDEITRVEGSWEETVAGIRNTLKTQIYVTTNTTLNKHNANSFLDTIDFIQKLGVTAFGCNSLIYSGKGVEVSNNFPLSLKALERILPKIRDKAAHVGLKFIWYTPTQYCQLDPVKLGLGVKACTAALINMCVAPNGDVYPCQSYFQSLGNMLRDSWKKIWNHSLAKQIRSRGYVEQKCKDCPQLQVCGGGCPLQLKNINYLCGESK